MNSEEAKDILQLCHPDHIEDLDDPLITEALERLDQDSALCVWFEEQQIVDAEISAELCRIVPASDLKESILRGMRKRVEASGSDSRVKNAEKENNQPNRPAESVTASDGDSSKFLLFRPWIGIAAALLFASVLLFFSFREPQPTLADKNLPSNEVATNPTTDTAGISDIIQFLGQQIADFHGSKFAKRSEQIDELQNYLTLSGMPNPDKIPQQLQTAATIGCAIFDYDGTKMSMICFKKGRVYHLITLNKTDLEKNHLQTDSSEAKVFEHQKQAFKVWSENSQIYILCTEGNKEDIPEFI